jgi:FMN-dependent NADH-azoreductase
VSDLPHMDGVTFGAAGTPTEERTDEQSTRAQRAGELIAEVEAADDIVIAAPMYNFSVPSTLKAWVDHIARAGRTFRYTENGPEGLLKSKKVYVVASRGGFYANNGTAAALDFHEPYLRGVLGFLGRLCRRNGHGTGRGREGHGQGTCSDRQISSASVGGIAHKDFLDLRPTTSLG